MFYLSDTCLASFRAVNTFSWRYRVFVEGMCVLKSSAVAYQFIISRIQRIVKLSRLVTSSSSQLLCPISWGRGTLLPIVITLSLAKLLSNPFSFKSSKVHPTLTSTHLTLGLTLERFSCYFHHFRHGATVIPPYNMA